MKHATVILAGGEGSRMGGGKPLRLLSGRTLLERAVAFARQSGGPMAIAVRSANQLPHQDVDLVIDERSIEGPLAGLVAGLGFAERQGAEALLTIPADMPFLPPDLEMRLAKAICGHGVAIARSGGNLHPVCGLWRAASADLLSRYLASGRRSLRGFAEMVGHVAVDWPSEPADPFFNVNSPRDLERAEARLGR